MTANELEVLVRELADALAAYADARTEAELVRRGREARTDAVKIDLRTCDDWVAVYKDGHKVWENHSCPLEEGLRALGIDYERIDLDDQMDEHGLGCLKDGGDPFPEDLNV